MFFKCYKWAILWALVILVLCGMPGRDIPHISFLEIPNFDKFVHAGIFFVLTLLIVRGFLLQTTFIKLQQNAKLIAFVICVVYGGLLEIMQGTLCQGRTAEVFDFFADSVGVAAGLLLYNWIEKKFLMRIIK